MKNLYNEKQYREYSKFMSRMANTDDIGVGFGIHMELDDWIAYYALGINALAQMDTRMEKEDMDELKGIKKEGKVVAFPTKRLKVDE